MKIYKISNVYYSGDYGSWIAPSGKIYRVKEFQGHIKELYNVFKNEGIRELPSSSLAKEYGFIRVHNINPLSFEFDSLTPDQKESIMNIVLEYRGALVFVNNKIFERNLGTEEIYKLLERF